MKTLLHVKMSPGRDTPQAMMTLAPWPNPAVPRSQPWSDSCLRSSLAVGRKPA